METILIVSSSVTLVMLIVVITIVIKLPDKMKSDGKNEDFEKLKMQLDLLVQNNSNQSESVTRQITMLGDSLRGSIDLQQGNQQTAINEKLKALSENFDALNKNIDKNLSELAENFEKIQSSMTEMLEKIRLDNQTSLEKMNGNVDKKLSGLSENFSGIQSTMTEMLEKIRLDNQTSLEKMNGNVDKKLSGLSENFSGIQSTMTEMLEKIRLDNQTSLEKMNGNVDKKLSGLSENFSGIQSTMTEMLEKIRLDNQTSLEKMNGNVDKKLSGLSENFSGIQSTMTEMLEKIRLDNQTSLEKMNGNVDKKLSGLSENFSGIQSTMTEMLEKIRLDNQTSLDKINDTVNEKLQKSLDDRISKSFETVNKRLAEVYEGLGEMKTVASGVSDLKKVLSNVKTRGIMGEIQLGAILDEILSGEQYVSQSKIIPDSDCMVDFAIKLPGAEEGEYVYLPIDSKFPGDAYSNLVDAYDSGDVNIINEKKAKLISTIKNEAKSISSKYILPPHTTNFAIMFLPFEGLYAEVINLGLVEVLQNEYKVTVAGPSNMAAMLNSLQMGFRTLAIQKKSAEVWKVLESAKKEFGKFKEVLEKTQNNLRLATNNLDTLIGTRTNKINSALKNVTVTDESEMIEED